MLCSFKISLLAVSGLLFALLTTGCGTEKREFVESNTHIAEKSVTPATKKPSTTSVAASKTETATSPAATDEIPAVDAEPEVVCRRFMELLKSGNRISAENLLTRTALTATSKAGLKLEPMGSPTAKYEMGTTRYATIKNELAQVDCIVVENVDGIDVRSPVTWLVRKQNLGWRISGLMVQLDPQRPMDLLSFENINDVQEIKRRASGEVLEALPDSDAETRQAKANEGEKLK